MPSRLTHVGESASLLRLSNDACMDIHFVSPHLHQRGLGLLLPFAVVNNAAVSMGVQISLENPAFVSCGCILRSGFARS